MPTIFFDHGYRFFFYSNEGQEPIHVHVENAAGVGKWWVVPQVKHVSGQGLSAKQCRIVTDIIERRRQEIIDAWNKHFGK